ncbi:DivIVA domain-containing protein [Actinophytocola oryzae]|uniref:Cell wall synthesis protein Wag31 n=1 Tax=Actinophytocola oryzae TaxID=502181 RepID=A0A4R7UZ77_9PSEU|nr:DivIVA domain-containing protein [Actinophytocola oryzae]TDV42238.1 DivIVA domain-containing protein [Actinophytocola oryzae]
MARSDQVTADDVRSVVFDQSRRMARGYSEEQVDAFLDLVADTIEALTAKLADKQADTGRVISEAHRNAETIVRRAQATAEQIEDEARQRAARMVADASRRMPMPPPPQQPPPPPMPPQINEEFAAAAVAVGTRIGGIRDALSAELASLYRLIGQVQNNGMRR